MWADTPVWIVYRRYKYTSRCWCWGAKTKVPVEAVASEGSLFHSACPCVLPSRLVLSKGDDPSVRVKITTNSPPDWITSSASQCCSTGPWVSVDELGVWRETMQIIAACPLALKRDYKESLPVLIWRVGGITGLSGLGRGLFLCSWGLFKNGITH